MKKFIFCLISFSVLMGCGKNKDEYVDGEGLIGKWKAVEQFQSPGNGGMYHPLPANEQFIVEFKPDSSFIFSNNFPKTDSAFNRFSVQQSSLLMRSTLNNKSDIWYFLDNNINQELILSIFTCIEGCAYKLRRVK